MENTYAIDSKNIRKTLRLSQQDLADLTGISRVTIARIETNRYKTKNSTLEALYSFAYLNNIEINENNMKFVRNIKELDEKKHKSNKYLNTNELLRLCKIQGYIFDSCIDNKINEKSFVKKFMKSEYAKIMDDGYYFISYMDEVRIVDEINMISRVGNKKPLRKEILHFMGYFYRYFCDLYEIPSRKAFKMIPFDYLYQNYNVLHSFDIEKASETVYEAFKENIF